MNDSPVFLYSCTLEVAACLFQRLGSDIIGHNEYWTISAGLPSRRLGCMQCCIPYLLHGVSCMQNQLM